MTWGDAARGLCLRLGELFVDGDAEREEGRGGVMGEVELHLDWLLAVDINVVFGGEEVVDGALEGGVVRTGIFDSSVWGGEG